MTVEMGSYTAIVLPGGGALGAYEYGVLTAL
jgi:predicted acylesterase/phospholipase RssA